MAFCTGCGRQIPEGGVCPVCTAPPPPPQYGSGKNFFASLFDFNLEETVTPVIIRILYIIGITLICLGALAALIGSISMAQYAGFETILFALIGIPLGAFLSLILLRVYLEIIMLLFNIYEKLKEIQAGLERRSE